MERLHRTDTPMIESLTRILLAQYKDIPFFVDDPTAHLFVALMAKRAMEQSEDGERYIFNYTEDCFDAAVLRYEKKFPQFGVTGDELLIALKPGCTDSIRWAARTLRSMVWQRDRITVGQLSPAHVDLIPTLYELGLGIDALGLIADTNEAMLSLQRRYPHPSQPQALGLTLEVLEQNALDDVIALRRRIFAEVPQYCWFGANEGHLTFHRTRLETDIQRPHAWFVLRKEGEVVGHFGSAISTENPIWGPIGGLELYFDPAIRGLGLANFAYRQTLETLSEGGARLFRGITAQPPVMHLGKKMGRRLFEIHLKHAPFFRPSHFETYLGAIG